MTSSEPPVESSSGQPVSEQPKNSHGLPIPPDLRSGPVVVGVDEATTCGRALRAAVFMSLALERQLLLVHVRRRTMPVIEGYVPVPEETAVGERIQDEVEEELIAALKDSPDLAGVDWELVTTVGDAAAELTRIAQDRDASLVVVGKRHTGFAELVHRIASGSVSRAMVAANKWPVMVVP
jgi:nucleotide-binding universal stress UspA family protein